MRALPLLTQTSFFPPLKPHPTPLLPPLPPFLSLSLPQLSALFSWPNKYIFDKGSSKSIHRGESERRRVALEFALFDGEKRATSANKTQPNWI